MSDYIEREAAIAVIYGQHVGGKDACENARPNTYGADLREIVADIEDIPAADVRPVVTCADCKYNTREVTDLFGNNAIQCITGLTHRRDWFCADGKKGEES